MRSSLFDDGVPTDVDFIQKAGDFPIQCSWKRRIRYDLFMILQITLVQTCRCGLISSSTYQSNPQEYLHNRRVCKTSESWPWKSLQTLE